MVADDAVKIRTDAVGATLLKGMAGGAFLRRGSPLLGRGGLQKLLDRLGRRRRGFLAAAWCCFLHRDFVARLFWHFGGENCTGGETRHQQNKAGAENRTENFIEFEGVHFWIRLQAGRATLAGEKRPRVSVRGGAFAP